MREIKFRAWSKFSETMYEVREIYFGRKEVKIRYEDGDCCVKSFDDVELMQYTGLHDKNGKEIYEGDVVKMHYFFDDCDEDLGIYTREDEITGVVECDLLEGFSVRVIGSDAYDYLRWTQDRYNGLEVVGNIYETNLEEL